MSKEQGAENKFLKSELDRWYERICTAEFIASDPVQFPHRYKRREDIEIAAFLAATIAWGRRDMILRSAEKMFAMMGKSPYDFVMSGDYKKLKERNVHRTFFEDDLKYFCRGLAHCYAKYGSLEGLFSVKARSENLSHGELGGTEKNKGQNMPDIWHGIKLFREEMAAANKGRYSKHISNAGEEGKGGSACKRLNLALRWLVREGPVDLGLWKNLTPSDLFIPLDVHVARTARKLRLLQRKSNDKKAVIELTEKLREFCPEDPVKYDYALFGIGIKKQ